MHPINDKILVSAQLLTQKKNSDLINIKTLSHLLVIKNLLSAPCINQSRRHLMPCPCV